MNYNIVKVTSKGQMTIPHLIRKKLNIKKDDSLIVYLQNDEIRIKKLSVVEPLGDNDPIWKFAGTLVDEPDVAENHDKYLVMEEKKHLEYKKDE
ncbi:AbrB/MazE/SpoVT family DNA-binding domain-containing protein [Biomaibacter acetigenes]|uniref:AbrB/MazE/SpoVT family DNA-binding domain-containing protein n=1 Tax=Biomaibacter acetigenes TaxID=2316383 RepID=A0A3G2R6Z9_9FIRM|nr:AbrB/MazE/SpoVT family DNA-binding domain-containing protein [Biomaibacter acetigenes]AYO31240.1 AbrB/MazE/SpoVT family DNA-binding domain-containing protein [Biomaibacter acetigenes]MDN5301061.1 hypothetical protein [Thermoanaerobacteraceae bacterium]MDN5311584.1 hypothetical protein [Thermoanaerobacteraceae bacterium]RKL64001.1 AbrB/MazE/SpoVT family DNA-binding domain-containing protein [Thermoanaerobacteraceae bacterium SP2]